MVYFLPSLFNQNESGKVVSLHLHISHFLPYTFFSVSTFYFSYLTFRHRPRRLPPSLSLSPSSHRHTVPSSLLSPSLNWESGRAVEIALTRALPGCAIHLLFYYAAPGLPGPLPFDLSPASFADNRHLSSPCLPVNVIISSLTAALRRGAPATKHIRQANISTAKGTALCNKPH